MTEALCTVLAVDDDRTAGLIFEAIARRYGYNVIVVNVCQSALATLQTAQFDVILMGWRLPDMDGMECVRLIRQRQGDRYTPIIAVTAYAMEGDREECLAAGCDAYMSKPFKLDELNDTIQCWAKKKMVRFRTKDESAGSPDVDRAVPES